MKFGLGMKMGLLFAAGSLGAFISVLLFWSYYVQADSAAINLSNSQRALAVQLGVWADMVALGQEEDRVGLQERVVIFEDTLTVLEQGGEIDGSVVPLPPEGAPAEAVAEVRAVWNDLRPALLAFANLPTASPGFEGAYRDLGPVVEALSIESAQVATLLQDEDLADKDRILWTLGAVAALSLSVLAGGLWYTSRFIVRPILQIDDAARRIRDGDLSVRVAVPGGNEIASLAETFNASAASLQELLVVRARLTQLVVSSPAMIYSARPSGDYAVTYISENLTPQLGYEPRDFTENASFWPDNIHPDDQTRVLTALSTLPEHGRLWTEYRFRHKDGTYRWMQNESWLVRDGAGEPVEIVGSWFDITERKTAEDALRKSEEQFRNIFENVPIGLCEVDMSAVKQIMDELSAAEIVDYSRYLEEHPETVGAALRSIRLSRFNPQILGWLGARNTEELAASLERIFLPETFPVFQAYMIAIAEGQSRFSAETLLQSLSGERRRFICRFSNQSPACDGVLVSMTDITEQRQLEEQLLQSQKVETLGTMAGGIAHEFNNILTVVIGQSDEVLERLSPDDALRSKVQTIKRSATRAAGLTRSMLAFSRKQVLQPVPLDLNAVVSNIQEMLGKMVREDVRLVLECNSTGQVQADRSQIEQVVMNLVSNAREAMPEGGTLRIETADVELGEDYAVSHMDMPAGPYVRLSVTDTGVGMDEATRARAFDPFFTKKFIGSGLGLSTVHGIVSQSGGHLWLYSEAGQGTTVKVYLPRLEKAGTEEPVGTSGVKSEQFQGDETIGNFTGKFAALIKLRISPS